MRFSLRHLIADELDTKQFAEHHWAMLQREPQFENHSGK